VGGQRFGAKDAAAGLVWPLLGLGGLSLGLDALPHGRGATIFVGLGAYGLALIAASRLSRESD